MERVPEPELMDEPEQANAYARADFAEPNQRFVDTLGSLFAMDTGRLVDLGCGPGDIAVRLATRYPRLHVDAVDGAEHMLYHGRAHLDAEPRLRPRLRFIQACLPDVDLPAASYDAVISNSLLHHLHDPDVLWKTIRRLGRPGAAVLVVDLFRPCSLAEALAIVDRYAANEPEILRRDFLHSLCAAFTPDEVVLQLRQAGLHRMQVGLISDRHLQVHGVLA